MRNHENGVQDLANLSPEQSILRKGARRVDSKGFLLRKLHVNTRNHVATMRTDTQRRGTHPNYFGLGCDRPYSMGRVSRLHETRRDILPPKMSIGVKGEVEKVELSYRESYFSLPSRSRFHARSKIYLQKGNAAKLSIILVPRHWSGAFTA